MCQPKSWLQQFVDEEGLNHLLALLSDHECAAGACGFWPRPARDAWQVGARKGLRDVGDALPQGHDEQRGRRALTSAFATCVPWLHRGRAQFGLNMILQTPAAVDQIAGALLDGADALRMEVIDLLTVIAWVSVEGHQ